MAAALGAADARDDTSAGRDEDRAESRERAEDDDEPDLGGKRLVGLAFECYCAFGYRTSVL